MVWFLYDRDPRYERVSGLKFLTEALEAHLEPSQTSKMKLFAKMVNG